MLPGRRPMRAHRHEVRRSEEHTSELQSRLHLVCRLLLEKKKLSALGIPPSRIEAVIVAGGPLRAIGFWPLVSDRNRLSAALDAALVSVGLASVRGAVPPP